MAEGEHGRVGCRTGIAERPVGVGYKARLEELLRGSPSRLGRKGGRQKHPVSVVHEEQWGSRRPRWPAPEHQMYLGVAGWTAELESRGRAGVAAAESKGYSVEGGKGMYGGKEVADCRWTMCHERFGL